MNKEIKEILNNADSSTKFKMVDEDGTEKEMNIAGLIEQLLNDNRNLLNYITNLQQENRQTKLLKERYQLEKEDYKSRNEKAINDLDILIEIIYQQPTENSADDLWLLDKLDGIKFRLNGGDEE